MQNQEVTKQHFVPRTYLKHFGQPEKGQDKIYRILRDDPDSGNIRQVAVAHACYQNDLYTLTGSIAEERMALENFYRLSVEDGYDKLRQVLLDENQEAASEELRSQVLHTVTTMMTRTTKLLAQSNKQMDRVLTMMWQLCQQNGSDTFDFGGEKHSVKGKSLDELQRDFRRRSQPDRAITQLDVALQLGMARQDDFGILVVTIDTEGGEFLTSDNPVIVRKVGGRTVAFDPESSLRLPIGPKHILYLMPGTHDTYKSRITRWNLVGERAKLERIGSNHEQQANAERWLLGSQDALERHIHERNLLQDQQKHSAGDMNNTCIVSRLRHLGLL